MGKKAEKTIIKKRKNRKKERWMTGYEGSGRKSNSTLFLSLSLVKEGGKNDEENMGAGNRN
jgi:hypothetical protein